MTCPRSRRAKRPFVVHTADLPPADRATKNGIPVTSLPRTILDIAHWEDARFGVELDVYETHGSRLSFEEDRERDDALLAAGIETTRVTGLRLDREPELVIASVRRHLARRSRAPLE